MDKRLGPDDTSLLLQYQPMNLGQEKFIDTKHVPCHKLAVQWGRELAQFIDGHVSNISHDTSPDVQC